MLYIVQAKTTRFVKVGSCTDLKDRLRQVQTGCPYDLEVLVALYSEGRKLEKDLHVQFATLRVRGEWFKLEGIVAKFVDNNRVSKNTKVREYLGVSTVNEVTA